MTDSQHRPIGEDDLQAYVDERLPSERRVLVEDYLAQHPQVAERVTAYVAQRNALRELCQHKIEEPIPARLRSEHLVEALAHRRSRRRALAASVAVALSLGGTLGGAGGWLAHDRLRQDAPSEEATYARAAVAAHKVFVADGRRPVEIRAEAQDQLVQWLSNRLKAPVSVPDLSGAGLRFMGGRLLPTPEGPAAQLMYDDDSGGRVTVFIAPARTQEGAKAQFVELPARRAVLDQVEALTWSGGHFAVTVAAPSGRGDPGQLDRLGDLLRRQLPVPAETL